MSGTDRYTMAEAARLKGVSYHTVSRAVRRGRLPVQRLGRMALIAADDLQAWTPMKERAPRKYQNRQPAPNATPALIDVVRGDRNEQAQNISALYEAIHTAAYEQSLADFVVVARDRFAHAFKLRRVVVWMFDPEMQTATRLTRTETVRTRFPERVGITDFAIFRNLSAASNARLIVDLGIEDPEVSAYFPPMERPQTVLLAPLRAGTQLVGVLLGDRAGERFDLTGAELALAQGVANQTALALANALQRDRAARRTSILESILDKVPEAICAVDASGSVTLSNRAYHAVAETGATYDASGAEPPQSTETGTVAGVPLAGADLTKALAGDEVVRRNQPYAPDGLPARTLSITARQLAHGGEVTGAVALVRDVTTNRETTRQRADHVAALEEATRKAETVATVVTEVNAGTTVQEVLAIAVARLAQELGGDSALGTLRGADGTFRARETWHLDLPSDFDGDFEPISYPNTILAFARQAPVFVSQDEGSTFERRMMHQFSWQGMLVVPFQLGDEHLGFTFVGYRDVLSAEQIDLTFAATLGLQCAHALEKVRLIEALESTHRRLLAVVDQIPQAVVIVSYPDGLVTIANRVAEEMWGYSLQGGGIHADRLPVLDPEGKPYARDVHPLMRSVRTGRSYLGEPMTIQRDDGETIEVLSNHAPIFTANGEMAGAVSILQDRAHFKPLDRVKDEFLSVVAHELRNPLTALRGNLQLLERRIRRTGELSPEEGLKRLETVVGQVDRITELVARLLDISRADLGRLDISVGQTDAAALVQKVSDEAVGMAPEREVRVSSPASLPVVWDEVRIEQVLDNLLSNAVRYAPGGPIEIVLREMADDRVQISVRDYGEGIPAWIRPRLFKQYYRFDDGRKDQNPSDDRKHGLGIGLYLSDRLVSAHGGTLEVDDAEGGGSIFTVSLPRIAVPPEKLADSR
ncbi:MAG: ATP-binding protein [Thermomicrobiales bacterium]